MSKAIKSRMSEQWVAEFRDLQDCVVVSYQGLTSSQTKELRQKLTKEKARLRVLRNALAGRAFEQLGIGCMKDLLSGPSAVAYGSDSVAVAKVLSQWVKDAGKEGKLKIQGGVLARQAIPAAQVEALAALPDRKTMMSQVLATVIAPATQVASLVQATLTQVPYLVQNHVEAMSKQEPQEAVQAAAAGS